MMALDTLISPELKRAFEERSKLVVIDPDDENDQHSRKEQDNTELKDLSLNLHE